MDYKKYMLDQFEKKLPEFKRKKEEELTQWKKYNDKACHNIVIFGAGIMGEKCCNYLETLGLEIDRVCDNNAELQSVVVTEKQNTIPVVPVEELTKGGEKILCFVATGSQHFEDIAKQLSSYNIEETVYAWHLDFYLEAMILVNQFGIVGVVDKISQLLTMFEDEESLKILLCHFARIFDLDMEVPYKVEFKDLCRSGQYFLEGGRYLQKGECMVDCGAFVGDTLNDLINVIGFFDFSNYSCYELDGSNYKILEETIAKLPEKMKSKIFANNFGVGNKTEKVSYVFNEGGSCIGRNGKRNGEIVTLDDQLGEQKVTFLKMDIEGSERAALEGARQVIEREKPMCAICVYHNLNDMFEVPHILQEYVPEYKLILRHHTKIWDETVCYAKMGEW